MSRAASLPGAELVDRKSIYFFKKPLDPGSFAAWGRTFFSDIGLFLEEATCPGQLRCLGQNFWQEFVFSFEEATCPGQLRCLGQNFLTENRLIFSRSHLFRAASLPGAELFSQKSDFFLKKPLVPGSFAAWGRTFS